MKNIIYLCFLVLFFSPYSNAQSKPVREQKEPVEHNSDYIKGDKPDSKENSDHDRTNHQPSVAAQDMVVVKGIVVDDKGKPLGGAILTDGITGEKYTAGPDGKFQLSVRKDTEVTVKSTSNSSYSFVAKKYSHVRINPINKTIEFCCTHDPAHCSDQLSSIEDYSKKYHCVFN